MGDNFGDGEPRERPVHVVELDAFYIGKYEVTNGEWRKFRDDPGYDDPKFWPGGSAGSQGPGALLAAGENHGGGTPNSDNYPVIGVNWDSAIGLLQMAQREDRENLPAADRGRMGKGGSRYRSTPVPVGQFDRSDLRELRRHPDLRHRAAGGLLRRQRARPVEDALECIALRSVRYGRQSDGVVPGLVQSRLLFGVAAQEPAGSGYGSLPRAARRIVLHRSVRSAILRAVGRVAVGAGTPHDRVPGGAAAVANMWSLSLEPCVPRSRDAAG